MNRHLRQSHLFQRRIQDGWSCSFSLHHTSGLPHPFLHTHRTKWNLNLQSVSLVSYNISRKIEVQEECTFDPINPLWEHAVYSAALFVTALWECFINRTILGLHISVVSHGAWALKHSVKWRGNWSQLFTFNVSRFKVNWVFALKTKLLYLCKNVSHESSAFPSQRIHVHTRSLR